ncbi:hypothetical protein L1887_12425 [Cichorium endivia]|nr:hypothetical protein L1887_12425 [Cichorium endivia]
MAQKLRCRELEEDEDDTDYDFLLPPKQVIGPDEHDLKKVIEYKFNDEGNREKITTTTRIRKLANARFSKRVVERRSWPKFGNVVQEDVGARLTMVSTEEIIFERPRLQAPNSLFSRLNMYPDTNSICSSFNTVLPTSFPRKKPTSSQKKKDVVCPPGRRDARQR